MNNNILADFRHNDWNIDIPDTNIIWITTNTDGLTEGNGNATFYVNISTYDIPDSGIYATKLPNDYMIVFSDDLEFGHSVDFSMQPSTSSNFRIYDMVNSNEVKYVFSDINGDSQMFEREPAEKLTFIYSL